MAYRQSASANQSTTTATIAQAFTTQNCVNDSLLWCVVWWNDVTKTCTVADDANGAWTAIGSPLTGVGGLSAFRTQMFYLPHNASTGKPTVTATVTASVTSRGLAIHEYDPGTPTPGTPDYRNANGSPVSTGAVTAFTGDVVAAYCVSGNSVSSVGSPFTLRELVNFGNNGTADDAPAAAGSVSAPFTLGVSTDNSLGIVAFTNAATRPVRFNPIPFMGR